MTETNPFSGPVGYARDDRVFGKGEGLVEAGHRLLEIQTQRLGFVTARSAVLRPGETAPASARNRRRRSYRGSSSSWIAARAVRETGAGPSMPISISDRSPASWTRASRTGRRGRQDPVHGAGSLKRQTWQRPPGFGPHACGDHLIPRPEQGDWRR